MSPNGDVAERAAIYDLVSLYFYLVDTRQYEAATCLFTEDAIDDHGPAFGGEIQGREALGQAFQMAGSVLDATQHFMGNYHISVDGDTAAGHFYMQAWHWLSSTADAGPRRPADFLILAAQVLDFRRTAEGWLISRQRIHVFGPGSGVAYGALPEAFGGGFGEDLLPSLYPRGGWTPG